MSVDHILNRPTLGEINALFHQQYGDRGVEIYQSFAMSSHIDIRHGGAPRTSYIAEYFLRKALGHPNSSPAIDYMALRGQFAMANKGLEPGKHIHAPSKKLLAKATCPFIMALVIPDTPDPPTQNDTLHAHAA
ncbi:MAG: hypothetical protein H6861_04415 [Rhodospirillales bacterium]|nr:hypothetical protein [Rhodospirillales bacterium]